MRAATTGGGAAGTRYSHTGHRRPGAVPPGESQTDHPSNECTWLGPNVPSVADRPASNLTGANPVEPIPGANEPAKESGMGSATA